MLGPTTFRFLNETIARPSEGWNENGRSQLWCYNLYYFDDLNARDADARRHWHVEAVTRWVRDTPAARGNAWAPYPTSLRVVNWIKWLLGGAPPEAIVLQSLATQVRVLRRRLELHLLGNHLFTNAKALVFAGLFFRGDEAERWIEKGMTILAREIPEQILPDGGQFERSPMYHALALEDVLDLINITNAFGDDVPRKWAGFVRSWPNLAHRMRAWLSAMCHPDGEISLFNDAAIGIAPSPSELERYAQHLVGLAGSTLAPTSPFQVRHLLESGYLRADALDVALLIDVAPVGPDYLPGHAHADTLSFELSIFGQRAIVNGGTSRYGLGAEREAERGTPAHSTVTINHQDSSEVWAGFRVARRARPFDLGVAIEGKRLRVSCAHDGYRRLKGKPVHRRTWLLQPGALRVEDRIEGRFETAVARFHLHPLVECGIDEAGSSGSLRLPAGQVVTWRASGGSARIERSFYCPEFGRREPSRCLAIELDHAGSTAMEFAW